MLMHASQVAEIAHLEPIAFAQMATSFPLPLVKDCLERTERYTYRLRALPQELMFYFALMLALAPKDSMDEVLRKTLDGNHAVFGRRTEHVPGKGGISLARIRLGYEPLKLAFDTACKPLSKQESPSTHFLGMLVCALDGTTVNVADTADNATFGRPKNQNDTPAAYPQARIVAAIECGTHAIIAAEVGNYHEGEVTLAREVIPRLPTRTLLLADRIYLGWALVRQAIEHGAQILWRLKSADKGRFKVTEQLQDGSYRALYHPPTSPKALAELVGIDLTPIPVRVFSYHVIDPATGKQSEEVHLVTTLLNAEKAPATRLAQLYMQRWEIELVFKEMKVSLNESKQVLRSNRRDLVLQEIYALMMTHHCLRALMFEAAQRAKLDPVEISFTAAIKIVRQKSLKSGYFFP